MAEPRFERRGLTPELVDRAFDEAQLRKALGELRDEERISDGVIDELLAGAKTEEEIAGPGGLLAQLTKRLVERALEVELTEHVGYEPHCEPEGGADNTRNGTTPKTLITDQRPVPIDAPRDRDSSFEPKLVRKRQRRFRGFDDKILALYSRGLSTRDIEAHLEEIYGVKVGRELISKVTDAVMDDVREWAKRPLEDVYPVVFLDALVLKIREGGSVQRKACYLALGVTVSGERDVLGHRQHLARFIPVTNPIEALNRQLRKAIKTKGHFPNEDATRKLIYLAVTNATPHWTRCRNWTIARRAFKIHFGDRLPDVT